MGLSSSMIFKKIENDGISVLEIIDCIKSKEYSPSMNEGFFIDEVANKTIYANYIYELPTIVSKFDESILDFKKEKTIVKTLISFSIDVSNNVLTIFSNASKSHRLITELGKILSIKLSISDIQFSPQTIISKFDSKNIKLNINSIKVNDFNFENKYIGTYWIKIFEQSTANELIERYSGQINFFAANLEMQDEKISIGFYSSGRIRIYNKLEEKYELIEKLKEFLFFEGD